MSVHLAVLALGESLVAPGAHWLQTIDNIIWNFKKLQKIFQVDDVEVSQGHVVMPRVVNDEKQDANNAAQWRLHDANNAAHWRLSNRIVCY